MQFQQARTRSLTVPVRHVIDAEAGHVMVEVSGDVTASEIFGTYAAIASDPALRPNLGVLADCRTVTSVPSFSELGTVACASAQAASAIRPTRAAVVVPTTWLFGIARQFAALAEMNGVRVVPFYAEADAKRWLTTDGEESIPASADR